MTITITLSGDQLVISGDKTIPVARSPIPGSDLPEVTFQNDTSLDLVLHFTTTPFTKDNYQIGQNPSSVTPAWEASVTADPYAFTVNKAPTPEATNGVQAAQGSINIAVIAE